MAFAGRFFTSQLLGPFAVGCWLHAHSFVVYHPIIVGVAGLPVAGLAALHLLIPLDQETEQLPVTVHCRHEDTASSVLLATAGDRKSCFYFLIVNLKKKFKRFYLFIFRERGREE